ncbi:hypothetical protein AGMMS49992_16570 [Clostridia bacterium]|nr:hypothetical protein AGMMS49992_16570 [Clostridia bacterium]
MIRYRILQRIFVRWEDHPTVRVYVDEGYAYINASAPENGYYIMSDGSRRD